MNLIEAFKASKTGKVRRKGWDRSRYFDYNVDGSYCKDDRNIATHITKEWLMADDWEPVEEEKSQCEEDQCKGAAYFHMNPGRTERTFEECIGRLLREKRALRRFVDKVALEFITIRNDYHAAAKKLLEEIGDD